MEAAPAVDIVITNHNYAGFLGEAIESGLRQTHPEVNVVVVDDGSDDDSRDVLRRYQDEVDVVLKENGGQASALNAGIARCRGDVVICLDADDRLRAKTAAHVAEAFAADPTLAKVQFRMAYMDASGCPTGRMKPTAHLRAPTGDLRRAELAFPFDLPWLPGGGTAFRTDAVRKILPIPEHEYPGSGADWYLVHLTALLGSASWVDEVGADYRVHGANQYEPQADRLDLDHVRDSISYAAPTAAGLARLADDLGLDRPQRILSISDLANRLISLRLEPRLHPVPGDRRLRLLADAGRAAARRFDVSWPMKILLFGWVAAEAVVPRRVARRLAELLLFPDSRGPINRFLGRLRREARPNGG